MQRHVALQYEISRGSGCEICQMCDGGSAMWGVLELVSFKAVWNAVKPPVGTGLELEVCGGMH